MGCGLWVVGCGLWVVGCGLWVRLPRSVPTGVSFISACYSVKLISQNNHYVLRYIGRSVVQ